MSLPPLPQLNKLRVIHTQNRAFRKCCGCIHLRIGGALSCIIWASLSFYFVVISFQSKSPFFSFLPSTIPFIIFGITNLLLGTISLFSLFAFYLNVYNIFLAVTPAILFGVGFVVVDAVINAILFITMRDDYINWCVSTAADTFQSSGQINTTTDLVDRDFYNCDRSWQDELKFGVLGTTMIVGFYVYWALCIRSYLFKKEVLLSTLMGASIDPMHGPPPHMGGPPPQLMRMAGGQPMIVLNNQKPFKNESKTIPV